MWSPGFIWAANAGAFRCNSSLTETNSGSGDGSFPFDLNHPTTGAEYVWARWRLESMALFSFGLQVSMAQAALLVGRRLAAAGTLGVLVTGTQDGIR